MNPALAIVASLSAVVTLVTIMFLRRLAPRAASTALLLCSVGAALAGLSVLSSPAVAFLLHSSSDGTFAGWCRDLVVHGDVSPWVGLPATAVIGVLLGRGFRRWRQLRISGREIPPGDSLTIVQSNELIALTTPGRHGRIIVSTGLLSALSPIERRAVIAHERAHLECRHDRFLMVSQVASALMPVVAPLERLISRSLERWADERAATEVGDRSAVARAIEHAATSTYTVPHLGSALAQSDVRLRLDALAVGGPGRSSTVATALVLSLGAAVSVANLGSVSFQLHRLAELVMHVCPF